MFPAFFVGGGGPCFSRNHRQAINPGYAPRYASAFWAVYRVPFDWIEPIISLTSASVTPPSGNGGDRTRQASALPITPGFQAPASLP